MARYRVEDTKFIDIKSVQDLEFSIWYKAKLDRTHRRHFLLRRKDYYLIDNTNVTTASTTTGFGIRRWFVCPSCSKRVKRLYKPESAYDWACRCCHELSYTSSQMSRRKTAM